MTETIKTLLEPIQNRLNAATPGPWEARLCAPCTKRGRLEMNIWDKAGNFLIANWCDDDPYEPADADFIANAPTDQARLLAAVQAVDEFIQDAAAQSPRELIPVPAVAGLLRNVVLSALTEAR